MYVLIVGRGPLISELKKLATELGVEENIVFINNAIHSEMPKWFNGMDVQVLPSITMPNWREQFGRVLIEAAACGVPSIGSSSGEIPIVLDSLGMENVFEEGNINQLGNEIIRLAQKTRNSSDIREFSIDKYGNKGIAAKLVSAFEKVM